MIRARLPAREDRTGLAEGGREAAEFAIPLSNPEILLPLAPPFAPHSQGDRLGSAGGC